MEVFSRWRFPRLLVVGLVFFVALVLVACGGGGAPADEQDSDTETEQVAPQDEEASQSATESQSAEAELDEVLEDLFYARHVGDLAKRFKLFSWSMKNPLAPSEDANVRFEFVGRGNVNGTPADEIVMNIDSMADSSEVRAWVTDDGTVLRMIINGDEQPAQVVSTFGQTVFLAVLWPFNLAEEFDILRFEQEVEGEPVVITSHTRSSEVLAGFRATVHEFTGHMGELDERSDFVFRFGHFGDFVLLLGWKAMEDGQVLEMELIPEEIVLR